MRTRNMKRDAMQNIASSGLLLAALIATATLAPSGAQARNPHVYYTFQGAEDGANPSGVIRDSLGNLYGTTPAGGGYGTIFKVTPDGSITNLYSFQGGKDGTDPVASLIQDKKGNL